MSIHTHGVCQRRGIACLPAFLPAYLLARVLTRRQEVNDKSAAQAGEIFFRTPSGMIYHDGQKNKILMARRHYPGACHVRALSARRRHPLSALMSAGAPTAPPDAAAPARPVLPCLARLQKLLERRLMRLARRTPRLGRPGFVRSRHDSRARRWGDGTCHTPRASCVTRAELCSDVQ